MKKSLLLILLFWPLLSMAQNTVFSGKWELNLKKTDFKQAPEWLVPRSFEIKQKNDAITIEAKAYDEHMVQYYYTETIPFDGKTSEIITNGGNKRLVSIRWNEDNKSFVLSIIINSDDGQQINGFTETWSLINDGKTLVVNRVATQANDYSISVYYDRQ